MGAKMLRIYDAFHRKSKHMQVKRSIEFMQIQLDQPENNQITYVLNWCEISNQI